MAVVQCNPSGSFDVGRLQVYVYRKVKDTGEIIDEVVTGGRLETVN